MDDLLDVVELKSEFTKYMENMSCLSVMKLHYGSRCKMAKLVPHCDQYTNFINYFTLMYCYFDIRNETTELLVMCLFGLIYWLFFCVIFVSIDQYYLPALKIAAIKLRMNEYLAGVILVGMANSTPEFMLNLTQVRNEAPTLNIAMSTAFTGICLCGGTICFLMPFRMNGSCVLRDFLFIVFLLELIRLYSCSSIPSNLIKAIKLQREIKVLRHLPSSPHLDKSLYSKIRTLTDLEVEDDTQILRMKVHYGIFYSGIFISPKPMTHRKKVDVESNRTVLHSIHNPKNRFLFTEFFEDLNPIDPDEWSLSGKFGRFKIIIKAPVTFVLRLLIPTVDYEAIKHGWSKLLNCLQIIINPFAFFVLTETMFYASVKRGEDYYWLIVFRYRIGLLSTLVTVPVATIVFFHSRTDIPPFYHTLFAFLTLITVILVVWICAWEMDVLVSIIGIVFDLSANYMTVSLNAISNAVPDIIACFHLAKNGYGKMAFGAIIGSTVFILISNTGTQFARAEPDYMFLLGDFGETLYIFLNITIYTTMWWCWTFDFQARRSAGIFMWCLFALFLLYATAAETNLIHDFTDDVYIELKG